MIDFGKLKGEYTALAYLVRSADRARDVLRRAAVGESTFTDGDCRTAFLALMRETTDDDALLLGVAQRNLPALRDDAAISAFLGLADNPAALEYEAERFSERAMMREHAEAMQRLHAQYGSQQAEFLLDLQQRIIDATNAKIAALRAEFPIIPQDAAEENGGASGATIDESLLHVPGFIDRVVEYSMLTAQRPNRVLSFAGALALLAHLAGRRFVGPNDARPNIYLIALADSGTGKDAPRKLNRKIAHDERIEASVQNDIGSGQGLEDALKRTPALLMQMDEFDTVLNVLKDARGNKQATESTWDMLLSVFSESNSNHSMRTKAANQQNRDAEGAIYAPSLTIFATAIPAKFYASLCERALTNGFLARSLIFQSGKRSKRNLSSGMVKNALPQSIRWKVRCLAEMRRCTDNSPVDRRDLVDVPFADGAEAEIERIDKEAERLYEIADSKDDTMERSVWNRSVELCMKLALLYAISEGIGTDNGFAISREAVIWAWKVVRPAQLQMLEMVREHTAETKFEENVKKVLRHIRKAKKKGITRGILSSAVKIQPRELDEIEATLLEREEITMTEIPRGKNGKSAKLYIAVKKAREGKEKGNEA